MDFRSNYSHNERSCSILTGLHFVAHDCCRGVDSLGCSWLPPFLATPWSILAVHCRLRHIGYTAESTSSVLRTSNRANKNTNLIKTKQIYYYTSLRHKAAINNKKTYRHLQCYIGLNCKSPVLWNEPEAQDDQFHNYRAAKIGPANDKLLAIGIEHDRRITKYSVGHSHIVAISV